jgi:serine/threonine-protein kinase
MGVLAFQMLTGQVPFDADSVITIIQHHYFTPVPDVASVRDDVPAGLLAVMYRALAKEPGQRFETTREMVRSLEAVPFSLEDKAQSEQMLRDLARGAAIPKVRTGSLPPLEDVRRSGAAALAAEATTVTSERAVPPRTSLEVPVPTRPAGRPLTAVVLGALVLATAGVWLSTRGGGTGADPDPIVPFARPAAAQPTGARPQRPRQDPPRQASHQDSQHAASDRAPAAPNRAAADPESAAAPATLAKGKLRVAAMPPFAEIFVDGHLVGIGSAFDVELPVGRRVLRITAPGSATFDTTITVNSDSTVNLGTKTLHNESGQ